MFAEEESAEMDQIAKRFKNVKRVTIPDSDESDDGEIAEIVAKLITTKKKAVQKQRNKFLSASENGVDTTLLFENLNAMSKERAGVVADVGIKVEGLGDRMNMMVQEQKKKEEKLKILSVNFDKALEPPRSSLKTMNGYIEQLKHDIIDCEEETLTFRKKSEDELKRQLNDKKRKIVDMA